MNTPNDARWSFAALNAREFFIDQTKSDDLTRANVFDYLTSGEDSVRVWRDRLADIVTPEEDEYAPRTTYDHSPSLSEAEAALDRANRRTGNGTFVSDEAALEELATAVADYYAVPRTPAASGNTPESRDSIRELLLKFLDVLEDASGLQRETSRPSQEIEAISDFLWYPYGVFAGNTNLKDDEQRRSAFDHLRREISDAFESEA